MSAEARLRMYVSNQDFEPLSRTNSDLALLGYMLDTNARLFDRHNARGILPGYQEHCSQLHKPTSNFSEPQGSSDTVDLVNLIS